MRHRLFARFGAGLSVLVLSACALNPLGGDDDEAAEPGQERIAFLSFEEQLEVDPELAGARVNLPSSAPNRFWRMEGGLPNNLLAHPALAEDISRGWRRDVGEGSTRDSRLSAPPVIDDGRLFVLDARGVVTAYDAESGKRVWRKRVRSEAKQDRDARVGGLAVTDGRIFITTGFGVVAALRAEDGADIWRRSVTSPMHAPPAVADGRVFVVSVDNELFAIDAGNGDVLWTYQSLAEPARILSASTPAVSGDLVVSPFASGELVALRVDNGRPIWSEALTRSNRNTPLAALNDIAGSPVIAGDIVYAVSHSGVLAALDRTTGQRIWALPASGIHRPWIVGGFLFLVTTDAELICVSRSNGRVYWINQLPLYDNPEKRKGKISWNGPVLAGGRLYMTASDGRLVSFSVQDGSKIESYKLGAPTFIPPVVANRTMYVLTEEGRLVTFK